MYQYHRHYQDHRFTNPNENQPPLPPPLPFDEQPAPPPPPPPPNQLPPQPLFNNLEREIAHTSRSYNDNNPPLPPPPPLIANQGFGTTPTYGNYEPRYIPSDVAMPTNQPCPPAGHMTLPRPLFQPEEINFQHSCFSMYHSNQQVAPPSILSSFPSWRERSPEERTHYNQYSAGFVVNRPLLNESDLQLSNRGPAAHPVVVTRKVIPAETIFDLPGRNERPSHIVIILRGLPGSGKSHLAKLMKEKELHYTSSVPRILSIDTYFINEVEKTEKDSKTGRRTTKKVEEYEYDVSLEPAYMASMLKQFNKTLAEGYFSMIIVDAVNSKVSDFDQFWSNAKTKGFETFVVELKEPIELCFQRNIHNRTRKEIEILSRQWETTPLHFLQLDTTSFVLCDNGVIDEVDMEMVNSDTELDNDSTIIVQQQGSHDGHHSSKPGLVKSRWEQESMSEDVLDKLDGFKRRKRSLHENDSEEVTMEELTLKEYLQKIEEEYRGEEEDGEPKKKRVRWADLESAKEEMRKKEIGFSMGSGWSKVSEEEVDRLLNQQTITNNDDDTSKNNCTTLNT